MKDMVKDIKMPDLGTTVEEMKILKWFKNEGDIVGRGEPLLEVETDKTSMEVESFVAGTLVEIVAAAEATVLAGDVIARVDDGR